MQKCFIAYFFKLFVTYFFRLVYIIGAAVGGRVSFNSNDEHDAMDGELVCRVLQLMNLTDARYILKFYTEKKEKFREIDITAQITNL